MNVKIETRWVRNIGWLDSYIINFVLCSLMFEFTVNFMTETNEINEINIEAITAIMKVNKTFPKLTEKLMFDSENQTE